MRFGADAKLFIATKSILGFGYGFITVIVVIYLKQIGVDPLTIGILISLAAAASSFQSVLVSLYADRLGRRRSLIFFSVLLAISCILLYASANLYVISAAFVIGCITVSGAGLDTFQALEQACLPETVEKEGRNYLFSFYNVAGSLLTSVGSLFAGLQGVFANTLHLQGFDSFRLYFVVYGMTAASLVILYSRLSANVETKAKAARASDPTSVAPIKERLKRYSIIARLSAFFSIDTFGSGLISPSILTLWFVVRFNAGVEQISVLYSVATLVGTITFPLAARIANRIGLVRTMVFTQIPSAFLLILMALSPTFILAVSFFLARTPIFIMDIPTKQAYTVTVVEPDQRTAAAALTTVTRNAAQSVSPSVSAYLIQAAEYSVPIFSAGILKLTYAALFYRSFRNRDR